MATQVLTPLTASISSLAPSDSPFSSQFPALPLTTEFDFYPTQPSRSQSGSNSNSASHSRDPPQLPNTNAAQHFYATVVQSNKSLLPLFHNVVAWMLKRDLLVTLHLHVRVVASVEVKKRCREDMERERAERAAKWSGKNARFQPPIRHIRQEKDGSGSRGSRNRGPPLAEEAIEEDEGDADEKTPHQLEEEAGDGDPDVVKPSSFEGSPNWFSLSPREARRRTRRLPSTSSSRALSSEYEGPYMSRRRSSARDRLESTSRGRSQVLEDVISENPFYESCEEDEGEDDVEGDDVEDDEESDDEDDPNAPSIIPDPGRATPKERRWLTKMGEGKSSWIVKRFEARVSLSVPPVHFLMLCYSIHQHFDGKCTDDEILYQADISRKQLREVLHHYDEYVSLFSSILPSRIFLSVSCRGPLSSAHHPSIGLSPRNHVRGIRFDTSFTRARGRRNRPLTTRLPYYHPLGLGPLSIIVLCGSPRETRFPNPNHRLLNCNPPSVPSPFAVTSWTQAALALLLLRLRAWSHALLFF